MHAQKKIYLPRTCNMLLTQQACPWGTGKRLLADDMHTTSCAWPLNLPQNHLENRIDLCKHLTRCLHRWGSISRGDPPIRTDDSRRHYDHHTTTGTYRAFQYQGAPGNGPSPSSTHHNCTRNDWTTLACSWGLPATSPKQRNDWLCKCMFRKKVQDSNQ